MSELLTSAVEFLGIIGVLVIQYFLVKRPQKWLGFVLPAIYFVLSIKSAIDVVQNGEAILGSVLTTALFVFFTGNFMTAMLLTVYWKRNEGKGRIAFYIVAVYLIFGAIFAMGTYFGLMNHILTDEESNPSPNVGMRYYDVTEEDTTDYPVMLEDLGVEPMEYRYTITSTMVMPNYKESEYVDSMVDDVENTTKLVTIDYEIRVAGAKELDSREKTLQKRYNGEPKATALDYGAEASYWLGDNLLLRFDDCIVYFRDSSSRRVLESETAAEFFREEFKIEKE